MPYTLCSALGMAGHMGPALRGAAIIQGGRRHPPLQGRTGTAQNGTLRTPSPTMGDTNRAKRDGGDGVPYTLCHCEERSDAAIRSPQPKKTDSHASDTVTGAE